MGRPRYRPLVAPPRIHRRSAARSARGNAPIALVSHRLVPPDLLSPHLVQSHLGRPCPGPHRVARRAARARSRVSHRGNNDANWNVRESARGCFACVRKVAQLTANRSSATPARMREGSYRFVKRHKTGADELTVRASRTLRPRHATEARSTYVRFDCRDLRAAVERVEDGLPKRAGRIPSALQNCGEVRRRRSLADIHEPRRPVARPRRRLSQPSPRARRTARARDPPNAAASPSRRFPAQAI